MGLFFKISEDGKYAEVVKGRNADELDNEQFSKIAKKVDIEKFLSFLPAEQNQKIRSVSNHLQIIKDKHIGKIWCDVGEYDSKNNIVNYYYVIGDKSFTYVRGGESGCGGEKLEEIIKYGDEFFGYGFMENHKKEMETDGVHYYSRNDEISEEEFKEYKKQIKILKKVREKSID